MAFPLQPDQLKNYVLTRWCCVRDGWFETGEIIGLRATCCPECDMPASFVEQCHGRTSRPLPFVSKPRLDASPQGAFQVSHTKGMVEKVGTDNQSRRRGGLKATGRPRKNRP